MRNTAQRGRRLTALAIGAVVATGVAASAHSSFDFGTSRDRDLADETRELFGFTKPIAASSTASLTAVEAQSNPAALATVAKGLKFKVVATVPSAPIIDQMALWPNSTNPTNLIACNEAGTTTPGVVNVDIASGTATTIVTGTSSCDGVRRTAWGTIVFSEENGGGANGGSTYELIDPLNTAGVTLDRTTGVFSGGTGASNLVRRSSLGKLSFEGHGLFANGVMYYGDENRPGNGAPGGAIFKFVPAAPFTGGPAITNLAASPLASGKVFGLRVAKRSGGTDYGQGTQTGFGTWVPICDDATATTCTNFDLRAATQGTVATLSYSASAVPVTKLTGFYRPEDLEVDETALAAGTVKVCGPNTGNEAVSHAWGEVICITDGTVATSLANTAVPDTQVLVLGSKELAMPDNIAFQPVRGNWLVHEDGDSDVTLKNNDLFSCLPDGADVDDQSDGCVRVATLNDLTAEWSGGIFDATGKHFYVSVQHNISGAGTILDITGWK